MVHPSRHDFNLLKIIFTVHFVYLVRDSFFVLRTGTNNKYYYNPTTVMLLYNEIYNYTTIVRSNLYSRVRISLKIMITLDRHCPKRWASELDIAGSRRLPPNDFCWTVDHGCLKIYQINIYLTTISCQIIYLTLKLVCLSAEVYLFTWIGYILLCC